MADEPVTHPTTFWPDPTKAQFYRNLALMTLVPGSLTYMISRALNKRLAEKEAQKFEQDVIDLVKAENPVISLDPSIEDQDKENTLDGLGVVKQAESGAWAKDASGMLVWNPTPTDTWRNNYFSGTAEPGILIALAYLASTAAWNMGKRKGNEVQLITELEKGKNAQNELERSEYMRLQQVSDPEGFMDTLPKTAVSEAAVIDVLIGAGPSNMGKVLAGVALHKADGWETAGTAEKYARGAWRLGMNILSALRHPLIGSRGAHERDVMSAVARGGDPAPLPPMTQAAKTAVDAAATGGRDWYPLLFVALLAGSYGIGKNIADRTDKNRQRQKNIKKVLTNETLANQSPTILDVGSDLPWEKAKRMPPGMAVDPNEGLPEEALKQQVRERREVRI